MNLLADKARLLHNPYSHAAGRAQERRISLRSASRFAASEGMEDAMTIAIKLKQYLDEAGAEYDTLLHGDTQTASQNAQVAQVPADCVAKSVVMRDGDGFLLAVLPSNRRIDLAALEEKLDQPLSLAGELETRDLFNDCYTGAIPPVGAAYGVRTLLDESLDDKEEIWFEGGDHRTLVHLAGDEFSRLMKDAQRESFSFRQ